MYVVGGLPEHTKFWPKTDVMNLLCKFSCF